MNFQEWFAAHRRRNPNAVINERTRDLYRAWLRNNDPGAGGPGAGRVPGLTPEAAQPAPSPAPAPNPAPAPAAPPPPPPVPAARIDAGREADILGLYNTLFGIPAQANLQRRDATTRTQAGLLDAGYFDTVGVSSEEAASQAKKVEFREEERTNPDGTKARVRVPVLSDYGAGEARPEGNVTYRLQLGPDGRIYRQAYMRNADTFAARGVSGSLVSDAQRDTRRSIDTSRDQSIRNYNDLIGRIGTNQSTATTQANTAINTANAGYTQWTGQQDAVLPGAAQAGGMGAAPTENVVTTPDPPAASGNQPPAGNLGTWTRQAAGANAIPRLTRQVRERNPGVSFRVVRRGNRYVAVRT